MSKKWNSNRVADIARLDFHDYFGRMYDRTRAKTTEKDKGILMLQKLEERFNISKDDRDKFLKKLHEEELKEVEEIREQMRKRKSQVVQWTRDEDGKIISPFDLKKTDPNKSV